MPVGNRRCEGPGEPVSWLHPDDGVLFGPAGIGRPGSDQRVHFDLIGGPGVPGRVSGPGFAFRRRNQRRVTLRPIRPSWVLPLRFPRGIGTIRPNVFFFIGLRKSARVLASPRGRQ
jgi:hypothetical protein